MFNNKEIVLVTGGSGLVGTCLREYVNELKCNNRQFVFLSSQDADLTQEHQVRRLFSEYKPSCVIHLAAKVGGLYANLADVNNQFYKLNMLMNENVLKMAYEFKVKKCLSCLSTCIFPDCINKYPFDESQIHNGPPHKSNEGYAMSKRHVDLLNRHYNRMAPSDQLFLSLVPPNIYGPHDNFKPNESHVVPSLIERAHELCIQEIKQQVVAKHLKVFGSGSPLRQFIYAPDLARLIIWSLDHFSDRNEPILILCPDQNEETSIQQVAEIICAKFSLKYNTHLRPSFDVTKSDGQMRKTASNRKFRQLNGKFQFTKLEQGISETIDWYCDAYPNVRNK